MLYANSCHHVESIMHCTKLQTLKLAILFAVVWLCVNFFQSKTPSVENEEEDLLTSGLRRIWHPRQRHLANILDLQLKHIQLYNQETSKDHRDYECVVSRTSPSFPICIYDVARDIFISAALKTDGIWEPFITKIYQRVLNKYPEAWVIDIGANIGYYSLLSAKMGHNVIAVEPMRENYERLYKSLQMGNLLDRAYLITNALSDDHKNVSLNRNHNNQGGIRIRETENKQGEQETAGAVPTATLDDLLQIMQSREALIKLDIEGYECRVMKQARKFLQNIYVPYILMEWKQMFLYQNAPRTFCAARDLRELCDFLTNQGYEPYEVQTHIRLNPARCTSIWRIGDIYWKHKEAKPIHPG